MDDGEDAKGEGGEEEEKKEDEERKVLEGTRARIEENDGSGKLVI